MSKYLVRDLSHTMADTTETFNDAVNRAIEIADKYHYGMEISEIKGNRKYFICGVTWVKDHRFVR